MMAGLLFARAGCKVLVLEKQVDFFRDFRGDTVHPSTMEILDQLGMLQLPWSVLTTRSIRRSFALAGRVDDRRPQPPRYAGALHRDDAAVEFLDFLRQEEGVPRLSSRDGSAGGAFSRRA